MAKYLDRDDFFHGRYGIFENGIPPTEENLALVREFLLEKWRDRARELGTPEANLPTDLSDSCKFSSLFGSVVFEADIAGNWSHVYNMVDGEIVDINEHASDVKGRNIYRNDSLFLESYDFRESMKTCRERVRNWLTEFEILYKADVEISSNEEPKSPAP